MVSLLSLWLPIVLSAVIVFVISSFIHMVLPYHKGDLRKLEKEDEVMAALRPFAIPPGDYAIPCAGSMAEAGSPEFAGKLKAGPVVFATVARNRTASMALSMSLWFLYALAVSVITAYVVGGTLPPGTRFLTVFRFSGCVAFAGFSLALLQQSIWYQRNWWTTVKAMFDGLIYGLLTGAVLGWLWPH